ncbi:sigma-70 family RNA polymerase sigma factor [Bradyrhizobium sp. LHD-71]|uniref:sigma-70 family RNA polymerase sigma factor n=1 Tax=Bradyrhizobium sp. LHD-71 TaxID=3072141 RepID=UPI00280F7D67|nr:sigma-70 family RNA polymerase sigma factor [Bradyrhizobium sp. LHD-71]MDQ8731106.1 sigma-70 family RNA polymerase sigma factor [Bradyrhizobium sp. LHD-71]
MEAKKIPLEQFEANRPHLRAVACRLLGSLTEAEDAVQETWLRLSQVEARDITNVGGWLTTTTARICLDMLRSRKTRREESLDKVEDRPVTREPGKTPEDQIAAADSIGLALFVVLERLAPAERLAFVLHDVFAVPFSEIAPIVRRSEGATRQLASRARSRVQASPIAGDAKRNRHWKLVEAFLKAAQGGDFDALLSVLDPDAVFRADDEAIRQGSVPEIRGAAAVAAAFKGRARSALPALVDGGFGLVIAPDEHRHVVLHLTFRNGRIAEIWAIANPERLARLELALLPD